MEDPVEFNKPGIGKVHGQSMNHLLSFSNIAGNLLLFLGSSEINQSV